MRILFLTQFFPPETGAPQNRLYSLAQHLKDFGAEITILTAMPNYPKGEIFENYKGKLIINESLDGLNVIRCWIFITKSKVLFLRLFNYFSFVITSFFIGVFKVKKLDIIFCESPPLFLGLTAFFLKKFKGAKLVFNVSDLWPETAEKLKIVNSRLLLTTSYKLEKFLYSKSDLVSGQTLGITTNINSRFPLINTYLLRNGIDIGYFEKIEKVGNIRESLDISITDFVILYAGIIGYAQGLEIILETAELMAEDSIVKFLIVGDGPVKVDLMRIADEKKLRNVTFVGNMPREDVLKIIMACDAYVVPLKKNDLFLGAIPSKIFEPMYLAKPILLGVDGEARQLFVNEGRCALYFEPENASELFQRITELRNNNDLYLDLSNNAKSFVISRFDRKEIAFHFWNKIVKL